MPKLVFRKSFKRRIDAFYEFASQGALVSATGSTGNAAMESDEKTSSRLEEIKARLTVLCAGQGLASAKGNSRRAAELQAEINAANRERADIVGQAEV